MLHAYLYNNFCCIPELFFRCKTIFSQQLDQRTCSTQILMSYHVDIFPSFFVNIFFQEENSLFQENKSKTNRKKKKKKAVSYLSSVC